MKTTASTRPPWRRALQALLAATLLASAGQVPAQGQQLPAAPETGFLNRQLRLQGVDYRYQVYVPADYTPATAWPVIVFLHGSGESGRDGLLQTEVGLGSALRHFAQRYPALVVFPQTPSPASGHALTAQISLAALDRTLAEFRADPQRIYLTGLSMGGSGAIYIATHHAERFAALVAICGWVAKPGSGIDSVDLDPGAEVLDAAAQQLLRLPTWLFHGDADSSVPVQQSRRLFAALQKAGAPARYTEIFGGNHNAWDAAYRSEDMAAWLMAQRRKP
jgi:predicted peptidase